MVVGVAATNSTARNFGSNLTSARSAEVAIYGASDEGGEVNNLNIVDVHSHIVVVSYRYLVGASSETRDLVLSVGFGSIGGQYVVGHESTVQVNAVGSR